MNKAFVRDPEPRDPACPERGGCGAVGLPVVAETLEVQLPEDARRELQGEAYYCPNPSCDVAYFDALGATVPLDRVAHPAYPKPETAPLCRCLDVTADEVVAEAQLGRRDLIRRIVAHAESGGCRGTTRMPAGRSCATEARRLFMASFRPS